MRRPSAEQAVITLISITMLSSAVWSIGSKVLPGVLRATQERGFSPELLALAVGVALTGLWAQALYFAGPLAASAAQLQWLPVGDVLRHDRLLMWLATAAAIALVITLTALVARAMGWPVPLVTAGTALTLVLTLVAVVRLQRRDAPGAVTLLSALLLLTALTLAAIQAWSLPIGTAVGVGFALVTVLQHRPAAPVGTAHPVVPRWQLVRGHGNRWSVNAGILTLDGDIVQAAREGQVRSTRKPLSALWYRMPWALSGIVLWRALTGVFLPAVALVLTGLIAGRLLGVGAGLAVFVVLQYRLTIATGRGAESWRTSSALQRIWGRGMTPVKLFVPALVSSVMVTALTVTALPVAAAGPVPLSAVFMLSAVPPLVLWRRDMAWRLEGLVLLSTPAGPLPLQTVNRAIAGYDVLAIAVLVALRVCLTWRVSCSR